MQCFPSCPPLNSLLSECRATCTSKHVGDQAFPGNGSSHGGAFAPQLRWLHLTGAPPGQHHSNRAEHSWSCWSPGVSSIISAGCKRQLLGRTGGPGAAPDMAGPCRSCCVITAHTGRCHGHSWRSTAGKSTGDRWHPRLCPSHTPLLGLGARAFWWRGSGHGPAQKGLALLMATRQPGVWLNCSAVAKEPRRSQETDGCAQ